MRSKKARRKFSTEQIVRMLREAEVELSKGQSVEAVRKRLGVTGNTHYRWRKKYGCLRLDQAKQLKELERENTRLKTLLANAHLDDAILREGARGE